MDSYTYMHHVLEQMDAHEGYHLACDDKEKFLKMYIKRDEA